MGFFISSYISGYADAPKELKQHINLSETAWAVIYEDIRNFYVTEDRQSFSGFLNRIFSNFYQSAAATISYRVREKKEEYCRLFSAKELAQVEPQLKKLLNEYEKKLKKEALSYPKGAGRKFRVNTSNFDLLGSSEESNYYDSIGEYLKAIYEEYSQKPSFERELIFLDDIVREIEYAISQQKKLKLSLLSKTSTNGQSTYTRQFYVWPHQIVHDKTGNFNYLVCYAEEIRTDGRDPEKKPASFRISRISKLTVMKEHAFISKQKQEELNRDILTKTPQFMAGDVIDVTVSFTKKGLEAFDRQIYMRPDNYSKLSASSYVFSCTEVQAINYFFKFGRDATIISPPELREKFAKRYKDAWDNYNGDASKQTPTDV